MTGTMNRKFTRREFATLFLAAALAGGASRASAAVNPAEGYVGKIADEVMSLANSGAKGTALRGRFASVLNRYVDLRNIANVALGPYRSKLPVASKSEFYKLFGNYAAALFVYFVDEFKGSDLKIISNTKQGRFTTIESAIVLRGGGRQEIQWRLVPTGGGYKVFDINIKGVWLTLATKKRFNDVLNRTKGDFEALFAELREAETW